MRLPDYLPPNAQRASAAAGLSPLLILGAFALTVMRLMDATTALAVCAACTVWVVYEMSAFQRHVDAYNHDYVRRHLVWRSRDALQAYVRSAAVPMATREFVQGFLDGDDRRTLGDDGPDPARR